MMEIRDKQGNVLTTIDGDSLGFIVIKNLSLREADLRNAIFIGSTIINVDFSDADLTGASFEGVSMCDCKFDGAKTDGVRWPAWEKHPAFM